MVYENDAYVSYKQIGVPCWKENRLRFKDWAAKTTFEHDFPELREEPGDTISSLPNPEDDEPRYYAPVSNSSLQDALQRLEHSFLNRRMQRP